MFARLVVALLFDLSIVRMDTRANGAGATWVVTQSEANVQFITGDSRRQYILISSHVRPLST